MDGAGLGLSIARWIVDEHRGTIRIQSTPNDGTAVDAFLSGDRGPGRCSLPGARKLASSLAVLNSCSATLRHPGSTIRRSRLFISNFRNVSVWGHLRTVTCRQSCHATTREYVVCGGDMDTLRMLRSEVSCYHCGHSVGTLEGPLGGPYTRFLPFGEVRGSIPSTVVAVRPLWWTNPGRAAKLVMIHPTVPFGRQRPGRKARIAVAQAM